MIPGGRLHGAIRYCVIAALVLGVAATAGRAASRDDNGIYIVGGLHALHETEESFDYAALEELIDAIDPEVMLLEVRPDELAERKETPGRPEYPAVIWPMLDESDVTAVGMEPGDPLFTEMVTRAREMREMLERERPGDQAFLSSYGEALEEALMAHWTTLPRTQDDVTGSLMRGRYIVRFAVAGEIAEQGQTRWDEHMVGVARRAIAANPDKRILVLGSYRNRHVFVEALRADFAERVVDMQQWLTQQ